MPVQDLNRFVLPGLWYIAWLARITSRAHREGLWTESPDGPVVAFHYIQFSSIYHGRYSGATAAKCIYPQRFYLGPVGNYYIVLDIAQRAVLSVYVIGALSLRNRVDL